MLFELKRNNQAQHHKIFSYVVKAATFNLK